MRTLLALALLTGPAPHSVSGDCTFAFANGVVTLHGYAVADDAVDANATAVKCDLYDAGGELVASTATLLPGPAAVTATAVPSAPSAFTICWTGFVLYDVDDQVEVGPVCIPPI